MLYAAVLLADGQRVAQAFDAHFAYRDAAQVEPLTERLDGARIWVLDNDAAICAGMRSLLEQ